jgi:hypothetical protein
MEETKHDKCPKCKCWRIPSSFLNDKGRKLKTCESCRARARQARELNKCEHKIRRCRCIDCGGVSICEHKRQRDRCIDCGGGSICDHKKQRYSCKDCGGSGICEHDRLRSTCKECDGGSICEHKRERSKCKECDPIGYLSSLIRSRTCQALKSNKNKRTMEYVGCTIEELKVHIEAQFEPGMTWANQGDWHIDHIIPLKYNNPTLEDVIERLHFVNTQPLWAAENIAKGNRFIG